MINTFLFGLDATAGLMSGPKKNAGRMSGVVTVVRPLSIKR
jgi:hypothetical protein